VLDISDRGPGIPPGDVERLKRPFTRGEPARTGAGGAGLGFAIVERIVALHGGRFDIVQREGGGTVAHITLPARAALGNNVKQD
jgi:two-component system osmolarity sensor histidine kinase EnvZ